MRAGPRFAASSASFARSRRPAAWFRFNTGITVTGAGVSSWADQSGNGRDLLQGTDTNRPALEVDGSILFDGVDNFMKCDAFTLDQPETIYMLFQQVTWVGDRVYLDGDTALSAYLHTFVGASPDIAVNAGGVGGDVLTSGMTVGQYGVLSAVANGAGSTIQVNNKIRDTGDAGAQNAGGCTLGSAADGTINGNIQVKEVALYPAAQYGAVNYRLRRYLGRVGALSFS